MPRFQFRLTPRSSLRCLLGLSLLFGVGAAWLANNYHQYRAEQQIIADLGRRSPPGAALSVATNGETEYLTGTMFM